MPIRICVSFFDILSLKSLDDRYWRDYHKTSSIRLWDSRQLGFGVRGEAHMSPFAGYVTERMWQKCLLPHRLHFKNLP